ncbi:MAG: hypothetical protein IJA81_09100 [Akkermansia sp.]|nr:hypothetical protein [Akkermansia sp.]
MPDTYLPYTELYRRVQARRAQLGLPPLSDRNSLGSRLHRLRHTGERGERRYSLADALRVYCTIRHRHAQPWNRPGTADEITSRKFMPLLTAVQAYRCHICHFDNAIHHLNLLAWRHPVTGARWVHIEQASYVAQWRSIHFLRRHLSPEQLEHITTTRPVRTTYTGDGYTQTCYFVPEYSHLGTRTTRYSKKDI